MSWQDILKNKNNMNFITQQRKYLESTTALTQEQKTKLRDSLELTCLVALFCISLLAVAPQ